MDGGFGPDRRGRESRICRPEKGGGTERIMMKIRKIEKNKENRRMIEIYMSYMPVNRFANRGVENYYTA